MSATGRSAGVAPFEVVALVASLGGLAAVSRILASLPAQFPAHVLVVQHGRPGQDPAVLTRLFQRLTPLPVRTAHHRNRLERQGITVVPAGHIATIDAARCITLTSAAAPDHLHGGDALLSSIAEAYGSRAIAVILTGMLHDGAAGARVVKRRGGRVLVQDPTTARAASMPASVIATGCIDFVLPLDCIGAALTALAMAPGAADLFTVPTAPWAKLHA